MDKKKKKERDETIKFITDHYVYVSEEDKKEAILLLEKLFDCLRYKNDNI